MSPAAAGVAKSSFRDSNTPAPRPLRCRVVSPLPIERPGKIVCVGINYRDHAVEQGFVRAGHRNMLVVDDDGERLLDRLVAAVPGGHPDERSEDGIAIRPRRFNRRE